MRSNLALSLPDISPPLLRATRPDELQRQIQKMFRRLRVAVIYAGNKESAGAVLHPAGNTRSWKSYQTVAEDIAKALTRLGLRDVAVVQEDMHLGRSLKEIDSHIAWLNSGGVQGFCSVAHAPAMLEMLGVPYVGHDPMVAAMLDNKHVFKRQLVAAGIPTAPFMVWHPTFSPPDPVDDEVFAGAFSANAKHFIVKPVSGRASLNVHFVPHPSMLKARAEEVFRVSGNHVLIEKFVPGREFCIAVAGPLVARRRLIERLDQPFSFAVLERVLEPGEHIFTSMDSKPISAARARPLDAVAEPVLFERLKQLACTVFVKMGIEALIRLDVRQDERGQLCVLEANPKPDLKAPSNTSTSLICLGLDSENMDYDDLILSQIAHRIDILFAQQRGTATRLRALI